MTKRCYGCMKLKNNSPICEHCGYNENVPNYSHQLPVGTVLKGQYTVGKVLGQGGFGITYIGWDDALEAPVAIKEYYPNSLVTRECTLSMEVSCTSRDAEDLFQRNRERFLKEARMLARLQNVPGIVRVHNLFRENNTAYIVMEYVDGINLRDYIRSLGRPLSVGQTLAVLQPVMEALTKVHEAELVHRDISPDNIMIQRDGSPKLLDFGAAKEVIDANVEKNLPQSTESILKYGFAPIEQYQRRGNLGPWTDVYALCATAYYCLTGTVPADAPERMIEQAEVNWNAIPGLTENQAAAFARGMALLPKDRVASIQQLQQALYAQPVYGERPEKPPKKPPVAAIAAVLAVVAAVGFFRNPSKEQPQPPVLETKPSVETDAPSTEITIAATSAETTAATAPSETLATFPAPTAATYTQIAAGLDHTIILFSDGTVKAIGSNEYGQCDVQDWSSIVRIAAGDAITMGLRADGTVVTAGNSSPYGPEVDSWQNITDISVSKHHLLGLKTDGTVVSSGGAPRYADASTWRNITAIGTAYTNSVGLRSDGTVVVKGTYRDGDLNGWDHITAISVSDAHFLGLRSDGTVKAAGLDNHDQCDVEDWTDIVAVGAGCGYSVGLKKDGTVLVQGLNDNGQHEARRWSDIVYISVGLDHIIGVKADGTFVSTGDNEYGECDVAQFSKK